MYDSLASLPADDVACLERISSRIRAGEQPPGRNEVEQALERGFGSLIGLEAQIQRTRAQPSADAVMSSRVDELQRWISMLREALIELRTLSSPPGPPRIGYGFVLPSRRSALSTSPARFPARHRRTPQRSD